MYLSMRYGPYDEANLNGLVDMALTLAEAMASFQVEWAR